MNEQADRRHLPRISCNLAAEYVIRNARPRQGRMLNIGPGGTLLSTDDAVFPVGLGLLVCFHLPLSNYPVGVGGTVRWVSPNQAGVEFGHLSQRTIDEIWKYYARESTRRMRGEVERPEPSGTKRALTEAREGVLAAWYRYLRESERPPTEPEERRRRNSHD